MFQKFIAGAKKLYYIVKFLKALIVGFEAFYKDLTGSELAPEPEDKKD